MIAVWILLGIAALLALALLLPLRTKLHFDAETGLHYRVYYAFVPLYDSDRPAPKPQKRPKTQPAKAGKPAKRKPRSDRGAIRSLLELLGLEDLRSIAAAKRALSEKGLLGLLSDLNAAVGSLLSATFGMLRKAVFRQFSLQIVVGDGDAADAAMRYGRVCAAVFSSSAASSAVRSSICVSSVVRRFSRSARRKTRTPCGRWLCRQA